MNTIANTTFRDSMSAQFERLVYELDAIDAQVDELQAQLSVRGRIEELDQDALLYEEDILELKQDIGLMREELEEDSRELVWERPDYMSFRERIMQGMRSIKQSFAQLERQLQYRF